MTLTLERLKQVLTYDPDTGVFVWLHRARSEFEDKRIWTAWNARCAGMPAGRKNSLGYIRIGIDTERHLAHRLAWLYVHSAWPEAVIDHIDGDEANNRISNLRDVPQAVNRRNSSMSIKNTSGFNGVVWAKRRGKWCAQINHNGMKNLGHFNTIEEAVAARKAADELYGFHANHGRIAN